MWVLLFHELSWETRAPRGPYNMAVAPSASHSLCPVTAFQLFLYSLDCQTSFTSIFSTLARFLSSPGAQASIRVLVKILQKFSLESSSTKYNSRQVPALNRYGLLCSSCKHGLTLPGNHSGKSGDMPTSPSAETSCVTLGKSLYLSVLHPRKRRFY